jgi:iron complex transport system substrate-binding protein
MSSRFLRRLVAVCSIVATGAFQAAEAEIVVHDDAGFEVRLEQPARRIVSLAPHITELLFEIGAGDAVIGAEPYSDYPAAAKDIPRMGGLSGIDIEAIVAAKPDLVIVWLSGTSRAQIELLTRLKIPVFRSEPHVLEDVTATLTRFGALTGHVDEAKADVARFAARDATLQATYSRRPPVRVFYQVWNKPLMTVGGPQLTTQVIALCGGRNVFASLPALAPLVDVEAVIAADPQLIVTTSTQADHAAEIAQWSGWSGVSAVRERRYLFLDPAIISRHTSRILIGAEALCRAIDAARG